MNYKKIHIGHIIKEQVVQQGLRMTRLCKFFKVTEEEVVAMYDQKSLDANTLIKWSKLLKQNLFLYYHYHLILHSQIGATARVDKSKSPFPQNFYTPELRNYFVNLVLKQGKKALEVRRRYKIPKATFYKWLQTAQTPELRERDTNTLLEAKPRVPMDYQAVFEEIAKERYGAAIPPEITQKIQQLDSIKAVQECSDLIFKTKTTANKGQKRYSEAFITQILQIQQEEKLTDKALAQRFNIGRDTVGRWRNERK